jgi:hypothetical protein
MSDAMRRAWAIGLFALLAASIAFAVAVVIPIERQLRGFDARVAALRREFSMRPADRDPVERVRAELRHMVEVDQTARDIARAPRERGDGALAQLYFQLRFHPKAVAIERRHVEQLTALIEQHGWIRSSRFGAQADRHAWLLAHHADVHPEFQKRVLAILETQWQRGETAGQNYARLAASAQRRSVSGGRALLTDRRASTRRRRNLASTPLVGARLVKAAQCVGAALRALSLGAVGTVEPYRGLEQRDRFARAIAMQQERGEKLRYVGEVRIELDRFARDAGAAKREVHRERGLVGRGGRLEVDPRQNVGIDPAAREATLAQLANDPRIRRVEHERSTGGIHQ